MRGRRSVAALVTLAIIVLLVMLPLALAPWLQPWLARLGLSDLDAIQQRISESLVKALQFVGPRALSIGQNTFDFVIDTFIMLYLLFFLLRDGDGLTARTRGGALPER